MPKRKPCSYWRRETMFHLIISKNTFNQGHGEKNGLFGFSFRFHQFFVLQSSWKHGGRIQQIKIPSHRWPRALEDKELVESEGEAKKSFFLSMPLIECGRWDAFRVLESHQIVHICVSWGPMSPILMCRWVSKCLWGVLGPKSASKTNDCQKTSFSSQNHYIKR